MASHRRFAVSLAGTAVVLAASAVSAASAAAATAPAVTNLGAIGFASVEVDNQRHHVLISGTTSNVIEVLSYSGAVVDTIPDVYGAWGMVVSGSTLYVAESTAGAIVKIDLKRPERKPVTIASGLFQPTWLVSTGGMLWTTVSTSFGDGYGELASIDPANGALKTFVATPPYYQPDLATSPGDPSTLFLSEDGLSPGAIYRLHIVHGTPSLVVSNTFTDQQNIEDLAVNATGSRVIPAAGAPEDFEELSATTLQPDGVIYPGENYPSAVATSPGKGGLVATGIDLGYSATDVLVDPLGTPAPIFTADTSSVDGLANVAPHGLALTSNGGYVFAVSASNGGDTVFNSFPLP